uniref:V-type proton ATPase proteolipid subunit n=1 Tax=Corethron hystrix TaxID=216773 RepID=A0A7S1BS78_9STRA|mmetsp:Transcript_37432/g.87301  ORF Transcript_37432/g.87301 Transcript_37432/m.87301 type:complete len:199 (+) Transcript_37432:139-735(+)|eukprot:CAMPEP_0113309936 /NCGR_PEP_ID=MMETSP0010_2-20120614/7775_1 /TAXON_ID=216773 ORGANISM="Corethron hystrix, Strain 308" /NCGR_SAMPLE_ID=MMETSP0010_2 /ASSEMBLY_ACC=CAM_ASM_000155 /LENGTH=198 /DNA_ID=CAMNT_0000165277 /DNA_START=119 /DNA_END=715 /DNA_ORIENTATION=+ /assembly_acc=CAM_ASM_000155
MVAYDTCPDFAPAFGYAGAGLCMILANFGSAWGTWKAGLGVCKMGIQSPGLVIKNIVPIVMAGVLGIYGLIVAVILTQSISKPGEYGNTYSLYSSYAHLAAGLCCGISCLAAGGTIGVIGEVGVNCIGLKATAGQRSWITHGLKNDDDINDSKVAITQEETNKLYVGLLIMLIFSEALALYGLIVALIVSQKQYTCGK